MRPLVLATYCLLASCYNLPSWKGDVVVHPLTRASIATCGTGALTTVGAKRISRPPYIQATTTTSTTIAWGSLDGEGEVAIKEPGGDKILTTVKATYAGDPDKEKARFAVQQKAGKEIANANDIYVLAAKIDKLEPTHLYCYQLLDAGTALTEPAPLTTAAAPGQDKPIKFVALGDTGTGGAAQMAIAKRMSEVAFDFMLFLGDIAYNSGTPNQLEDKFFTVYKDFFRYVPIYPTIGNHERKTRQGHPYIEAFVLPDPERYYSWNWGDVHFVAIDTTQRDTGQLAWLQHDLSTNKQPWTIVFGHHPPYTSSFRGPQLWVRQAFAKIATENKVDIFLTGHEHQYERFRIGGVNYVVSGGGGAQLVGFWGNTNAIKQKTVHHFLSFEATKDKLSMKAIDIEGKVIDTLELSKNKAQPPSQPIPTEKKIVPDEKVHDEKDDDSKEKKQI